LDKVAKYVKTGGKLIFSTCTVYQGENIDNRNWFLENYEFEPVSLNEYLPEKLHSETTEQGYLQLIPGIHNTDGFFISKFQRK
jgi:16S rRNA (cytosine967-C5)-methyltransferase